MIESAGGRKILESFSN